MKSRSTAASRLERLHETSFFSFPFISSHPIISAHLAVSVFGFLVLVVDSHWARMMDTLFPLLLSKSRTLQGRTSNLVGIVVQGLRAAI